MDTKSSARHTDQDAAALRSRDEVRAALSYAGVSVSAWAKAHGFKPSTVAAVLRGDRPARIGQSHRIAIALKIKSGAIVESPKDV